MKPEIALDLSVDGIAVLSRAPAGPDAGKWYREGVVRLDAPDMAERLRGLRARCADRLGPDFTSILVIPDSQLLFTSLERDDRDPEETIRTQLAGRTPYAVEDLAFDYVGRGDRLQVAVVAIETLSEAESFAAEFGFRPVALVAAPKGAAFHGLAHLGATGIARELIGSGRLDLDLGDAFHVIPAPASAIERLGQSPVPMPDPMSDAAPASAPVLPDAPQSFADFVAAPAVPSLPTPPRPVVPPVAPSAPPRAKEGPSIRTSLPDRQATTSPEPAQPPSRPSSESRSDAGPSAGAGSATRPADPPPTSDSVPTFSTRRRHTPLGSDLPDVAKSLRIDRPAPPLTIQRATEAGPETGSPAQDAAGGAERTRMPAAMAKIDAALRGPSASPRFAGRRGLGALAARLGIPRARPRAVPVPAASAMAADGALSEAEALSLPGFARTRAAPPPRRAGARTRLYLALSVLGLLVAFALWVVLGPSDGRPVDNATPAASPSPAATPASSVGMASSDTPGGASTGEDTGRDASTDASPDAGTDTATGSDMPGLPPPAEPDVALLLPASRDAVAGTPSTSGLVSAPLPLTDASPEEIAEAVDADPALTPVPDPALATDGRSALERFTTDGRFDAAPGLASPPNTRDGSEIYLASIDPVVVDGDAVALPRIAPPKDAFSPQTSPAPAGTAFSTGEDGLTVPSAEGSLAPGGYRVVAGRPAVMPARRPGALPAAPAAATVEGQTGEAQTGENSAGEDDAARAELRRVRPVVRPDDAEERVERVAFNGLSRAEITRKRPAPRPAAIKARATAAAERTEAVQVAVQEERSAAVQAATSAALASLAQQPVDAEPAASDGPASRYALARSERPNVRPRTVEQSAARIVTARQEAAPAAPDRAVTSQPAARQADSGPQTVRSAGGSVTRAATESNAISLREMNLIGVYGSAKARRALIRMANGRYVKVEVGDRLDRGRVVAIGESEVVYQRGGRNVALRMPQT